MSQAKTLFKELRENRETAMSNKRRVTVFLLAVLLPIGIHELYLKRQIKFFGHIGFLIFFSLGPFVLFYQFAYALYFAYVFAEAFYYLLSPKAKDGDGFRLKALPFLSDPRLKQKLTILLAFITPFGIHVYLLDRPKRASITTVFFFYLLFFYLIGLLFQPFLPALIIYAPIIFIVFVIICWVDGFRLFWQRKPW